MKKSYKPESKLEKPQIDTEKLNFNKQSLENTYQSKEQIVQSKIDDTREMIEQTKVANQARRGGIGDKVDEKIVTNKADIAQEKQEIQAKGEAIKQKVKERAKDGAIWSAGKELLEKGNE